MIIDSHIHLNSMCYSDLDERIERIENNSNIESVINVGLNYASSFESADLANKYNKLYASVGIHPLHIEFEKTDKLYLLIDNKKVVAIGEIGLDSFGDIEKQKEKFYEQLTIANNVGLPVIIHANNTNEEIVNIFKNELKPQYGCVFHCFQPDFDTLNYLISKDYFISFAGKITKPNAKKSLEVIKRTPLNNILVETDNPYIKIYPKNDIKYIIETIATIKEIDIEEVEEKTRENTKRLFRRMQ